MINSSNIFFFHHKQCSCCYFQKLLISIMVYPAQSLETLPAPIPSCRFIFAEMWLFVYNYVSADSWDGFAEKILKKYYFLTRRWSFEIVPEISLPPYSTDNIAYCVRRLSLMPCFYRKRSEYSWMKTEAVSSFISLITRRKAFVCPCWSNKGFLPRCTDLRLTCLLIEAELMNVQSGWGFWA